MRHVKATKGAEKAPSNLGWCGNEVSRKGSKRSVTYFYPQAAQICMFFNEQIDKCIKDFSAETASLCLSLEKKISCGHDL